MFGVTKTKRTADFVWKMIVICPFWWEADVKVTSHIVFKEAYVRILV